MNLAPTNEYRPMRAWAYFGYQILFTIPIIGLIFLIIYSFDNSYIARRNFARSFFCTIALGIIMVIIFVVIFMGSISSLL